MEGLVNIEKPCENFRLSKPLCAGGSLMTQFINLDIEKNLHYMYTSSKMLVIHK